MAVNKKRESFRNEEEIIVVRSVRDSHANISKPSKEKGSFANKFKKQLPNFLKEQIAKYETIFDHNPTEDEIKRSFIGQLADTSDDVFKELDQEQMDTFNQDFFYSEIYLLYLRRDDKENAEKYLDKLPKETDTDTHYVQERDSLLKGQIVKYETIFEHNPSDDYLDLFGRSKEEYLESVNHDQDVCYLHIGILYQDRGDEENAEKYLKKCSQKINVDTQGTEPRHVQEREIIHL